jgi:hypothetical protein
MLAAYRTTCWNCGGGFRLPVAEDQTREQGWLWTRLWMLVALASKSESLGELVTGKLLQKSKKWGQALTKICI